MSEPTIDQVAPGGIVQLQDAPAGLDDATFDSLFPTNPAPIAPPQAAPSTQGTSAPSQTPTQTQTPAPQVQVQGQTQEDFLKGEKSVYKTRDAAIEGINQKDALIEQLRQRYALTTGIDPITGQPIGTGVGQNQQQMVDYASNPKKYIDDLYEAAKNGGPEAYAAVQQKFLMDQLKPLQPILQNSVRQQAIEAVSKEIKDFGSFRVTPIYQKALDSVPQLKEAITTAESDIRFSAQLPGLYKAAYLVAQGLQLPEILRAQNTVTQTQTPTQQQPVRTTTAPSTPSIPSQVVRPNLRTLDGIRATIAEAEARGVKLDF